MSRCEAVVCLAYSIAKLADIIRHYRRILVQKCYIGGERIYLICQDKRGIIQLLCGNIVTVETESILKLCAVIGRYEREYEKAVHI